MASNAELFGVFHYVSLAQLLSSRIAGVWDSKTLMWPHWWKEINNSVAFALNMTYNAIISIIAESTSSYTIVIVLGDMPKIAVLPA